MNRVLSLNFNFSGKSAIKNVNINGMREKMVVVVGGRGSVVRRMLLYKWGKGILASEQKNKVPE